MRPGPPRYTVAVARIGILRLDLDLFESLEHRLLPDAIVVQEDRNLVMAPSGVLDLDASQDLDSASEAAASHRPLALGRYLLARCHDRRANWIYRAVVHDFACRPTCRPGDVRRSLSAIMEDATGRGINSLACEPIGRWREEGLQLEEVVDAIDRAILESSIHLTRPLRLTVMLANLDELEEASHLFRARILQRASRSFRTVGGDAAVAEVRWGGERLHFRFVPGSMSGYMVTRVTHVA